MARKYVDCRETPSISGCTLAMIGEEDELVKAAVEHAISVHGHTESPEELAGFIRADMKDAPGAFA